MNSILSFIFLAFAVSAISITVTKGKIFEPVRERISAWSEWWGKLITCPYCTSHWVSLALIAWYRPAFVHSGVRFIDLIVAAFAIVALASMISWLVYRSLKQLEPVDHEEVEELRTALEAARGLILQQENKIKASSSKAS